MSKRYLHNYGNSLTLSARILPANPDFAKVYRFLGNVFEIGVAGNLQKLKGMPPIDRETIILLMRNLAINLASPVFAEQVSVRALKTLWGLAIISFLSGSREVARDHLFRLSLNC